MKAKRDMTPFAAREGGLLVSPAPRLRWLSAWHACSQVLEMVMDVGRPPLARFPAGDVRLSETLITYADLDEAIAKVPAGCACKSGALDFSVISCHSRTLQTCPTVSGLASSVHPQRCCGLQASGNMHA